ncbi:MAG: phage tail protein [Dysgonamonadaceae bacterium]|jgi:phage tail-like protein|nr:phage tail protein [Dysgonamonadaceae bacterium]
MDIWQLPVAFYFSVSIDSENAPFNEVSGLDVEMEMESISEGGQNTFQHQLPKQIKHGNLVLKGAKLPLDSKFVSWVKNTLENDFGTTTESKLVIINLLNENAKPLCTWTCTNAFPVKWAVDSLDANKNSVLLETVELSYSTIKRS